MWDCNEDPDGILEDAAEQERRHIEDTIRYCEDMWEDDRCEEDYDE